jgi:hypothetical protein
MEIKNKSEQTIGLYENYGLRFIGKTAVYYSNLFNEEKDIITHIAIINTTTGKKVYSRSLENNFIFMDAFNRSCDEILFYFSHNTLDNYSINKTIASVLIHNNGTLFVHRMKQLIAQEEKHLSMIKQVEENEKQYNEVITACNEKNFILYNNGGKFFVLTFKDADTKQSFINTQDLYKQSYIEHADKMGINIIAEHDTTIWGYNNKFCYSGINELLNKIA